MRWETDNPSTAEYVGEHCGTCWTDAKRFQAIRYGEWRATATGDGKTAGFHLSGLYSPWTPLEDAARDFLASKRDPMRLKTWVNTFLGETWEDQGEQIDEFDLIDRREDFGEALPEEVLLLTAGVDVQDDRLEYEIVGWGRGEESWSIDYQVLYGDPSTVELWTRLDEALQFAYDHPVHGEMVVRSSCVDSGGHYTQQVYNYARQRSGRRVFAIKGVGGEGRPVVGRPSKNNIGKINLFPVGTDTAKELVYSRLKMQTSGEGYCHFPLGRSEEYFRMLTAEKKVVKYFKGRPRREWVKVRTRNEALDCRVYATAALAILNLNLEAVYKRAQNRVSSPEKAAPARRPSMPRRNSFVHGYK